MLLYHTFAHLNLYIHFFSHLDSFLSFWMSVWVRLVVSVKYKSLDRWLIHQLPAPAPRLRHCLCHLSKLSYHSLTTQRPYSLQICTDRSMLALISRKEPLWKTELMNIFTCSLRLALRTLVRSGDNQDRRFSICSCLCTQISCV